MTSPPSTAALERASCRATSSSAARASRNALALVAMASATPPVHGVDARAAHADGMGGGPTVRALAAVAAALAVWILTARDSGRLSRRRAALLAFALVLAELDRPFPFVEVLLGPPRRPLTLAGKTDAHGRLVVHEGAVTLEKKHRLSLRPSASYLCIEIDRSFGFFI